MSPVKQAVQKLERSVDTLERALRQPRSFAPEVAIVDKKITSAIDKVEALLRQG